MSRYVKVVSDNNGPFLPSNKMVYFKIPDYGTVDFSKSRININTQIHNTQGATADMPAPFSFQKGGQDKPATNMDFIKNVKLQSVKYGMLEQIQEVGLLHNTLSKHTKSVEKTMLSDDYNVYRSVDYNHSAGDIFGNYEKLGTIPSTWKVAPIANKMSDICPIFETNQVVNMADMGELVLSVELDLNNITFAPYDLATAATLPAGKKAMANSNFAVGATTVDQFTTTAVYSDLSASPFYVGQTVSGAGTGITAGNVVISQIEWLDTRQLRITAATGLAAVAAAQTGITLTPVNGAAYSAEYLSCELALCYVADDMAEPLRPYRTFSTEKTTVPAQTNLNHNFNIDSNCLSVFMCSPIASTNKSNYDVSTQWEMFLNNESLTDGESVRIYDGLSKEKLTLALINSGFMPAKLSDAEQDIITLLTVAKPLGYDVIASPVKYSPAQQQLQVRVLSSAANVAPTNIVLFKHVIKSL